MSQRILSGNGEEILPGEDDIISPLAFPVRVTLPPVGDGTGDTVAPGWTIVLTTENAGSIEIVDQGERLVTIVEARSSGQVVSINQHAGWSVTDIPLSYPADRLIGGGAGGPHTHPISDVDGLQAALDAKSALSHTHVISEVTSLQATLDGKADDAHSHVVADTTGLQAALDGKAATSHTHAIGDTTGLQTALDGKAPTSHTHAQADVTGLVAALAGKSDTGHTHAASEIVSGVLAAARIATGTPDGTKFLRDDQTWQTPAGGGGGATYLYKSADQVISAAGFVDIAGLTFAVAAGKAYAIEVYIVFQSSATTMGVLIGFNGPASPALVSLRSRKEITAVATASTDKFSEAVISAYNTANPNSAAEIAANTNLAHYFLGTFVNGVNAGTFAMRLSKENVAGNATIKASSWLKYMLLN